MIVIRVYSALETLNVVLEEHTTCCGNGTCPEPDQRTYSGSYAHERCTPTRDYLEVRDLLFECIGRVPSARYSLALHALPPVF